MMEKRKIIRRTLVGSSAFAMAISLAACEQEPNAAMFTSVEQCLENKPEGAVNWTQQCDAALRTAEIEHRNAAPRYDSMEVCEAEHGRGRCDDGAENSSGGSFFMPFMMGYMVSNFMNGSSSNSYASGRPLYSSTKKTGYFTSDGRKIGSSFNGKPFSVSKSATKAPNLSKPPKVMTKATVKKAGGFGASKTISRSSGSRSFGRGG